MSVAISAATATTMCWIRLENEPEAEKLYVVTQTTFELDLHAMKTAVIQKLPALKDLTPGRIEVFVSDNLTKALRPGTRLDSLTITDVSPLVIRYPLSN